MREVLNLHLGGSGITMGEHFWARLCDEHGIDGATGALNPDAGPVADAVNRFGIDAFFREEEGGKRFVPRGVLADCGCIEIDSSLASLMQPNQQMACRASADAEHLALGSNEGIKQMLHNVLRQEFERCDGLQTLQVFHSLHGSTGAAFCGGFLEEVSDFHGRFPLVHHVVAPSSRELAKSSVASINTVWSLHRLIYHAELVSLFNLEEACAWAGRRRPSTFGGPREAASVSSSEGYDCIGEFICNITSCHRFPGVQRMTMKKMASELIAFPRLHFLTPSLSARYRSGDARTADHIEDLSLEIQRDASALNCVKLNAGRTLTAVAVLRGEESDVLPMSECLMSFRKRSPSKMFAEWIPHNIALGHCSVPSQRSQKNSSSASLTTTRSVSLLQHSTAVGPALIKPVLEQYDASLCLAKKAPLENHLHGLSKADLDEAYADVADLLAEYQTNEDTTIEDYDGEFDDDDDG